MRPELFTVAGYSMPSYSFFLYLAALTVVTGSFWLARKRGMPGKKVLALLLIMLPGALIGARLLNILVNRQAYLSDPRLIYSLGSHGLSLFGGVLAAGFLALIFCRNLKIDLWKLGDAGAPFLGLGIALVRLGCFLNGCCFGKITSLPWGVRFPALSQAHIYQLAHGEGNILASLPVHPTELYELLAALAASGLAIYMMKKNYPAGSAMLTFLIFFTAFRWINYSFFRVMPDTFDAPPYFYPLLYAGIILTSLVLLWLKMGSKK